MAIMLTEKKVLTALKAAANTPGDFYIDDMSPVYVIDGWFDLEAMATALNDAYLEDDSDAPSNS
jgi:hypothetical protein